MIHLFLTVLIMSLCAATATAALLIISPITKRIFSPRWNYYIWLSVLMIMIIPLKLPYQTVKNIPTVYVIQSTYKAESSEQYAEQTSESVQNNNETQTLLDILPLCSKIWIIGMLLAVMLRMTGYKRLCLLLKSNSYETLDFKFERNVSVKQSPIVTSPIIIGIFKPTLYLPESIPADISVDFVLLHEAVHYKRRDLAFKWLGVLASTIHWFNPFSYVILRRIEIECELSCDYEAVKELTLSERKEYMRTILSFAEPKNLRGRLAAGISGDKKFLKKRLTLIQSPPKIKKRLSAVSPLLALIIIFCAACANGTVKKDTVSTATDVFDAYLTDNNNSEIESVSNETTSQITGNINNIKNMEKPIKNAVVTSSIPSTEVQSHTEASNTEAKNSETETETPLGNFDLLQLNSNDGISYLKNSLEQDGRFSGSTNLKQGYIEKTYSYKEGNDTKTENVSCGEDGSIKIYFETTSDNIIKVSISDAETSDEVGTYAVLANNNNVYSFGGLNTEKSYNLEVISETAGEWVIDGSYIIY